MGGGNKESTGSRASIPKEVSPYVKDLLSKGQTASGLVSDQPYGGQFLAGANPNERAGWQAQANYGASLGTNFGQGLVDLGNKQASGYYLNPETNPYLAPQIQSMTDEIMRGYQDQRKGVTSQSISQGAYGGDRGQLAQAELARGTGQTIADSAGNLLFNNYMQERTNQQNSGQLLQQGAGLNLLGGQVQQEAGAGMRTLDQIAVDEQMAKFNEVNTAPFRPLEPYANLVYGSAPMYQNTKVTRREADGGWVGGVTGALTSILGLGMLSGG